MTRTRVAALVLLCAAFLTIPAQTGNAAQLRQTEPDQILIFSKTAGFRHDSIPAGVQAIRDLGFTADHTEDGNAFTTANLARYKAVVFLNTTGDVLNATQQSAFESYIKAGGGFAGIHSAADTEYDWPFYGGLVGAYFKSHPAIQQAQVKVEDRAHGSTAHLPSTWTRTDEWYNYRTNPRPNLHVLATLNEGSYSGGDMGDHPTSWCQPYQGGRAWYTGGGHTVASYGEAAFRAHLLGGIRYAAGESKADCRPENGYARLLDSTTGWKQAGPGGFTYTDGTLNSFGGLGLYWYQAQQYGSYSLKLDWKLAGDGNSGVFVGFPAGDDPWSAVNNGYEVQIDATDTPDKTTGAIYGFKAPDTAARDAALNPSGQWNTFELLVQGERLQVFLNGMKINDFTNTDPARSLAQGYIGLQNHGDPDQVSFRNVRIKTGSGPITGIGGKCVDVNGANPADGTKIQLWTCNGSAAQAWTLPGDGTIRALGKCMDVKGGATANGTVVQLWTCNGGGAQQWTPQTGGTLRNPESNRCLDATGGSTANGTQLIIWDCHGGANQKWALLP